MTCVHRYELLKRLGAGGFGTVFHSRCQLCGWEVAIKMLNDVSDPDARNRFEREVRQLKHLDHPHIIPLLGCNLKCAKPFYVMPLMEGGSLDSYAGHLTFDDVAYVSWVLASTLNHLHEQNALHRDVKPHNVLLSAQGSVRLGDFGGGNHPLCTVRYTATAFGTRGYAAPEIANGATKATDIYSFGATLYHLLTGIQPLGAQQLNPRIQRPDVPEGLNQLVWRCTDPNPVNRPTAPQILRELNNGMDDLAVLPPEPPPQKNSWWIDLLAGAAGVLVIGGAMAAIAAVLDDE